MAEYILISIVIVLTIVVIGMGYFFYTKLSQNQQSVTDLIDKYKTIESQLNKPNPRQEITELFPSSSQQLPSPCKDCSIEPINLKIRDKITTSVVAKNNDDDDDFDKYVSDGDPSKE